LARLSALLAGRSAVLGRSGWLVLAALVGCSSEQPTGTQEVLDPTATQKDVGTLVDISDIVEVSQRMVNSLRQSPQVASLIGKARPVRISIDPREVKNLTSMTNFSKRLFVNQMLASLNKNAGDDLAFIDREAVAAERERQLSGEVKPAGELDPASAGADLVLTGRILEKLDREPTGGGAVKEVRSVQFSFSLVQVKDALTLWSDVFYRVKQQVIGTVYG
jgi:PBP1b-binding outer membrane lipoprotein LpoB